MAAPKSSAPPAPNSPPPPTATATPSKAVRSTGQPDSIISEQDGTIPLLGNGCQRIHLGLAAASIFTPSAIIIPSISLIRMDCVKKTWCQIGHLCLTPPAPDPLSASGLEVPIQDDQFNQDMLDLGETAIDFFSLFYGPPSVPFTKATKRAIEFKNHANSLDSTFGRKIYLSFFEVGIFNRHLCQSMSRPRQRWVAPPRGRRNGRR